MASLADRLRDAPGLLEACDDERLFGVTLTPRQRELLVEVERGGLLHVWALGRRSGKTLLGTLVALWFCTLRPDLAQYARRRERRYAVSVATNARQARINVRQARELVDGSPFLSGLVDGVTEDEITFKSGTALAAFPCTSRGGRGWPVMTVLMDEAAHMMDGEGNQAAEPVYRALTPSVAQFGAAARVIVASSPYGVDGFFAELFATVEKGDLEGARFAQAGTLEVRPEMSPVALDMERARDPEGYQAEYGAEFVAAGGAYLDPVRLAAASERVGALPPGAVTGAIGAIDLGFVSDATALAIVGRDPTNRKMLRLVLARSWKPEVGPLGFAPTLDEIAAACHEHDVRRVYVDQHSAIAAVEYLAGHRIHATVVPTTAVSKSRMFADLKTRIYGGELTLYEQPELLAELRRVETVTTPGAASIRIRRLGHSHGDLATALALACSRLRGNGNPGRLSIPRGRIPNVNTATSSEQLANYLGVPLYDSRNWTT